MGTSNFIIDLIKGFFAKTPKRLAIFRNICIVLAAIVGAVLYVQNAGLVQLPEWLLTITSPDGFIGLIIAAAGVQLAKKDINEK